MSDIAIKFENISKQYRLGNIGTGTLSHDLKRWWVVNFRGKEDPYLKIGQVNAHSEKSNGDYIWALKDIHLEVKEGEVLGIIGKNGAGKSTLLKILSRVTTPTTGRISAKGRIASLLEIGTGFHPEMTGRQNIYMNGSIMGMTKAEINHKLEEIVDFAGVEKYIDTPVKRYSSGMTVRLGFAIAAHLEPEILVVDEVLAVGDAEFQKKAVGKMQNVSTKEGRSVLFVSHNLGVVKSLCNTGIVLINGKIGTHKTDIQSAIDNYIATTFSHTGNSRIKDRKDRVGSSELILTELELIDSFRNSEIDIGLPISIRIKYESCYELFKGNFLVSINTLENQCIMFLESAIIKNFDNEFKQKGEIIIRLSNEIALTPGKYYISIAAFVNGNMADYIKEALIFIVREGVFFDNGKVPVGKCLCFVKQQWNIFYE